MPFLVPQLRQVASDYDGAKPLPRRLERIAALLAAGDDSQATIAKRCRVSHDSITRLKRHPAFRARLAVLADDFAKRAAEEEPLAHAGRRVALVGEEVRALRDQLHANGYVTTLGVSKQGNPIVGFDSARVSAMLRGVALLDQMTTPRSSALADTTTVGVQATVTLDQAVVRVQALLSRVADDGQGAGTPQAPGVGGDISAAGSDTMASGGSRQGPQHVLDAKGEGEG